MKIAQAALAVISLYNLVFSVVSDSNFEVKTDLIGPDRVRLTWEDDPETDGNIPARYRVLCIAPDSSTVEAVVKEKMVELDTFKEGLTYNCEVHPIFEDLVEGMDVISANPGTSAPFTMAYQTVAPAIEEPSDEEETPPPVVTTPIEEKVTEAPMTTEQPEERAIPEVAVAPSVHADVIDALSARVEWTAVEDHNIPASRYRVVCNTSDSSRKTIQIASTVESSVVIDTFEPAVEYTCSVYAIWDNLVPGVEVVSLAPGISDPFQMPSRAGRLLTWTTSFVTILTMLLCQMPTF
nr:Fibronectin type III [Hymenolepis microstoma]